MAKVIAEECRPPPHRANTPATSSNLIKYWKGLERLMANARPLRRASATALLPALSQKRTTLRRNKASTFVLTTILGIKRAFCAPLVSQALGVDDGTQWPEAVLERERAAVRSRVTFPRI